MGVRAAAALFAAAMVFGASAAAAAPLRPPSLYPVATLWSADAPGAVCAIGRKLMISTAPMRVRSGLFSVHGELTAEILAPQPLAQRVTRSARTCADQAIAASAAAALLLDEAADAPSLSSLMQGCLVRAKASRYIGAVTLWMDSDCAL